MHRLPENIVKRIRIDENECWNWTAHIDKGGYGKFCYKGKTWSSHRLVWTLINGNIDNEQLDHYRINSGPNKAPCSKACANPSHLEEVSQVENIDRYYKYLNPKKTKTTTIKKTKAPKLITHCPKGHEYTPDNTYIIKKTRSKHCRECGRQRHRESYRTKKT